MRDLFISLAREFPTLYLEGEAEYAQFRSFIATLKENNENENLESILRTFLRESSSSVKMTNNIQGFMASGRRRIKIKVLFPRAPHFIYPYY